MTKGEWLNTMIQRQKGKTFKPSNPLVYGSFIDTKSDQLFAVHTVSTNGQMAVISYIGSVSPTIFGDNLQKISGTQMERFSVIQMNLVNDSDFLLQIEREGFTLQDAIYREDEFSGFLKNYSS